MVDILPARTKSSQIRNQPNRGQSPTFSSDALFVSAEFSGDARFDGVSFSGSARFDDASFSGSVRFDDTTFSGGVWFVSAEFSGGARFDGVFFSSSPARFEEVRFGAKTVSFGEPKQWGPPPPVFDWDHDIRQKPANVEPQSWPPAVATD
ncbi:pentapeptide repeat-containing protein [Nocardia sp. NPDC004151]|uniref:pentapeptide repeat-containing protein n=1 Tax=Nocardia sp. NPDC004151 TaxID=3364304 RepID=UPI0036B18060